VRLTGTSTRFNEGREGGAVEGNHGGNGTGARRNSEMMTGTGRVRAESVPPTSGPCFISVGKATSLLAEVYPHVTVGKSPLAVSTTIITKYFILN
jgi:hypothetical protein